jgi:hypothetical protein
VAQDQELTSSASTSYGGYTLDERGVLESLLLGEEREGGWRSVGVLEHVPRSLPGALELLRISPAGRKMI